MDFVHQVNLTVVLTEFVFGVNQNQATFCSHLSTAFEESQCIFFECRIFFRSSQTFRQDFFFRDILVMHTHFSFRRRSDDRSRELFVFTHSFRQAYTTDFAYTALIGTPCTSAQVAAYNHFYGETFAHDAYSNHRVRSSQFPVRANVCSCIQKLGSNLVQHLSFVRDSFRKYNIECRDSVCSDHDQFFIVDVVNITYFTVVHAFLTRKVIVCFC